MIQKLHKRKNITKLYVEPDEGERTLLCSNEGGMRSPSLDLTGNNTAAEERLIASLAELLVEGLLWHYKHHNEQ